MTAPNPPDAVVMRVHRELAANTLLQVRPLSNNVLAWIESGDERLLLQSPSGGYPFTLVAPRTAQSLANLEAAMRAEYAGVVTAAGLVRAEFETYGEAKASSAACRNLVAELETLKNG